MTLHKRLIGVVAAMFVLPACLKQPKIKKLTPLTEQTAHLSTTQKDVTVYSKSLNERECKELFAGRTPFDFCQPVQIKIINNSNHVINIDDQSINVLTLDATTVFKKLKSNMLKNAGIGYCIGHTVIGAGWAYLVYLLSTGFGPSVFSPWPSVAGSFLFGPLVLPPMLLFEGLILPSVLLGGALIVIPAIIGCWYNSINLEIEQNLQANALQLPYVLEPGQDINGLIFVQKPISHMPILSVTYCSGEQLNFNILT